MMRTRQNRSLNQLLHNRLSICLILMVTFFLPGCSYPTDNKALNPSKFINNKTEQQASKINFQFTVHIPHPIKDAESITLKILDEVTGLPYNKQIHELTRIDEQEYSIKLPFTVGSVLKYPYEKI